MQHEEVVEELKPFLGTDEDIHFIEDDASLRAKTSLRMLYEAQSAVIQRQIGDLETVRSNLGLSQRKISQLLLVDPSSWTRWTRKGDQVPPHIWRALQWYLTLKEKIPGLTPQYFIGQDPKILHEKALQKIGEETQRRMDLERALSEKESALRQEIFEKETRLRTQIFLLEKRHRKIRGILLLSLISTLGIVAILLGQILFRQ